MHVSMSRSIQVWGFRFSYSYSYFCTRIVSYRIVLIFPYSGMSPTSFVLCTYSSTSLSVLISYRIVSYSYFRTRVRHLPHSFSARTRVCHYPYSYRIVSYRTRISVLRYVTYLIRSLHVLEYVIIRTRIVSYRIVLVFPYSGTSPTSFVLCMYLSTSLSVLVSYHIVLVFPYSGTSPTSFVLCTYLSTSLSVLDLGARQMGTAFAAFSLPTTVPFFFDGNFLT